MNVRRILHYGALVTGLLVSIFFTLFLVPESVAGLIGGKFYSIPILFIMLASVGGYIWSVTNPAKGGIVMISGGLIMTVYLIIAGGFEGLGMGPIFGLPFIIPGLLFYFTADYRQNPAKK